MFATGIMCQVYNMFNPDEPYIQQLSFMFVAMPGVLAIIHHYYCHEPHHAPPCKDNTNKEERQHNQRDTRRSTSHGQVLNQTKKATQDHVADTSSAVIAAATCSALSPLEEGEASAFLGDDFDDDKSWPQYDPLH